MGKVIAAQFGSDPVGIVETEDGPFMAVEAFCRNHHIDVARQLSRLQSEKIYREGVRLMPLGPQQTITPFLRAELMHGFLLGIPDDDAGDPSARERLQAFKESGHRLLGRSLGVQPYADPFAGTSRTERPTNARTQL